ncbi:hypothetical protein FZ046_10660 [Mycolicibacterium grossiae]|nr:hypothetical protein FZ046_10660 [Mycolicibacterium grossiae]
MCEVVTSDNGLAQCSSNSPPTITSALALVAFAWLIAPSRRVIATERLRSAAPAPSSGYGRSIFKPVSASSDGTQVPPIV